jgi:protein disulfide-isomerase A6
MLAVGAVNADEHKSLAGEYGIKGFPTIKVSVHILGGLSMYEGCRRGDSSNKQSSDHFI